MFGQTHSTIGCLFGWFIYLFFLQCSHNHAWVIVMDGKISGRKDQDYSQIITSPFCIHFAVFLALMQRFFFFSCDNEQLTENNVRCERKTCKEWKVHLFTVSQLPEKPSWVSVGWNSFKIRQVNTPQHFELQPNEHHQLPSHPGPQIFIQLMACLLTCEAVLNYPLTDTHRHWNVA